MDYNTNKNLLHIIKDLSIIFLIEIKPATLKTKNIGI
jgi:hypothetical protein